MFIKSGVALEPDTHELRYLEEILQSKCFKRAPVLCGLLRFLWNNRGYEISEYAIAVDALGRNIDFEPKIDATVRVQISRLRRILAKYYEFEGRLSTKRLVIPLGSHKIRLDEVVLEVEPASTKEGTPEIAFDSETVTPLTKKIPTRELPATPCQFLILAMGATIVILLFGLGGLLWSSLHRSSQITSSKSELPVFWKMFLNNGKPTRIVLPTPLFFIFHGVDHKQPSTDNSLMARDISVNEISNLEDSNRLLNLEKHFGKPRTWQNYTVASDALAALRLVHFLDSYGIQVSISTSAESPHEIIEHENVVALGTTTSLGIYQSDIDRLSYKLGPHEAYVIDRRLPPGGPLQFPKQIESASRTVIPGLVALLPRGSSGSRILILQGAQTTALISWLTSESGMRELTEAQADQGHSPFFEAVVLSEVNEGNPIQSRMVAFRPFTTDGIELSQVNGAWLMSRHAAPRFLAPVVTR
jgi:hypothetical protein